MNHGIVPWFSYNNKKKEVSFWTIESFTNFFFIFSYKLGGFIVFEMSICFVLVL